MESSRCVGLMAVLAVSSSVALVVLQFHKRLLSDFMKKAELELTDLYFGWKLKGGRRSRRQKKKKVSFSADVKEPANDNKEYRRRKRSSRVEEGGISMAG
ncbi:hypothetical protein KSP40_PGU009169 [Platanthera guangdongensis]|uniref:Uncharacterized protein n=1 Tax=Platanthera guangdongensis TaxID=2320717 RepID=A0ABR2MII6_9ASPA